MHELEIVSSEMKVISQQEFPTCELIHRGGNLALELAIDDG